MKRVYWYLIISLMLIVSPLIVLAQKVAQEAAPVVLDPNLMPAPGSSWQAWVSWAIGTGIVVAWEIVVRYFKTPFSLSIFTWIGKIAKLLPQDNKTNGGAH